MRKIPTRESESDSSYELCDAPALGPLCPSRLWPGLTWRLLLKRLLGFASGADFSSERVRMRVYVWIGHVSWLGPRVLVCNKGSLVCSLSRKHYSNSFIHA